MTSIRFHPRFALRRTVRFALGPQPSRVAFAGARHNPYAGWPSMAGLGVYSEIDVEVTGQPDRVTGYLIDIADVDRAVRDSVLPWLHELFLSQFAAHTAAASASSSNHAPLDVAATMPAMTARIASALPLAAGSALRAVTWRLTPTLSYSCEMFMPVTIGLAESGESGAVELRQRFEFSASHRLHCNELDDANNIRIFGKCNNPSGHGHNYRLEAAVIVPLTGATFSHADLERIVDTTVIARFDHKHLNTDVAEFASLNPSVEHITKVAHDLLQPVIAAAGATLRSVTVWETEKTCCTYPVR